MLVKMVSILIIVPPVIKIMNVIYKFLIIYVLDKSSKSKKTVKRKTAEPTRSSKKKKNDGVPTVEQESKGDNETEGKRKSKTKDSGDSKEKEVIYMFSSFSK